MRTARVDVKELWMRMDLPTIEESRDAVVEAAREATRKLAARARKRRVKGKKHEG